MTGLLCLAVASLVGNVGIAMTSQANSFKTPIVDFMFQNFNTFVDKYNEFHDEDLIATKLLRSRDLILEDDKTGHYFDFDFGFMVASDDYEIYLISNADLVYEDDLFQRNDTLYFTGSAFYDESGFEYGIST